MRGKDCSRGDKPMSNQTEANATGAPQTESFATKYEELLAASRAAAGRADNYRLRSYAVANAMRTGIANFLGCPLQAVGFRPVLKPAETTKPYSAISAMELGEDGYWHFGLLFTVPPHLLVLRFMMKVTPKESFVVKPFWLSGGAPEFEVAAEKGDFSAIAQWVFERMKDEFEAGLDRFLAGDDETAKIGFLSRLK
jgi:hypothetical protein